MADNVYFGESKRAREENGGGSYRGGDSGYRGGSAGGDSYRSFDEAPAASAFSELSDTDGELPF